MASHSIDKAVSGHRACTKGHLPEFSEEIGFCSRFRLIFFTYSSQRADKMSTVSKKTGGGLQIERTGPAGDLSIRSVLIGLNKDGSGKNR